MHPHRILCYTCISPQTTLSPHSCNCPLCCTSVRCDVGTQPGNSQLHRSHRCTCNDRRQSRRFHGYRTRHRNLHLESSVHESEDIAFFHSCCHIDLGSTCTVLYLRHMCLRRHKEVDYCCPTGRCAANNPCRRKILSRKPRSQRWCSGTGLTCSHNPLRRHR